VVSDLPAVCLQEELLALSVSPALSRLRPRVAVVSCPVFPGLARVPAVARPVPLARLSAAAGQQVQPARQLAESEASAQPGLALQPEEPAVQDAAVVPEAVWVAAEAPLQAAELPGVAAGPQREARDAAAGQRPAARDAAAGQQLAARDAAGGQQLAAQDVAAGQPEAPGGPAVELPSAAAWAFHRGRVLPWPEPQPVARFARATARLQIAARSARWWRAATNEVLS
jgi:hypothetical protein